MLVTYFAWVAQRLVGGVGALGGLSWEPLPHPLPLPNIPAPGPDTGWQNGNFHTHTPQNQEGHTLSGPLPTDFSSSQTVPPLGPVYFILIPSTDPQLQLPPACVLSGINPFPHLENGAPDTC
jgi:hypothetical protein